MGWKLRKITDDALRETCKNSSSFRQVALALGLKGGGTFAALKERIESIKIDTSHFTGQTWNKGLTKDHPAVARNAEKLSAALKGRPGRPHTFESRQRLSRSASERSFGNNARVKWYEVLNPTLGRMVKVQGTWEKRYAEWLNQQEIRWERPALTFSWSRGGDDIEHAYHPDFYLPESDTYVDIKGYMWKNEDKKIDDELKLRLVQEQNPQLRLQILMKDNLKQLGVL